MNKRLKQFYKHWIPTLVSTSYEEYRVYATEDDLYDNDVVIVVNSFFFAFDNIMDEFPYQTSSQEFLDSITPSEYYE